eukprot:TRINITY_DN17159_c0_g1_i1.p2 TRINITY_DN17159_c0_g1~~TRINITY_DN17159_c0_g1_i1.p2  ORF type:complete len:231 (-),score=68.31 TRINITY_DN17159_c0_g1_i1:76-768(-)
MDAECAADYVAALVGGTDAASASQLALVFESTQPPPISVGAYVQRLLSSFEKDENGASIEATFACVFLERLCADGRLCVTSTNAHRLFLASMLVATKYLFDGARHCNCCFAATSGITRYLALLGGIPIKELARLEIAFLMSIGFHLVVQPDDYYAFVARCKRAHQRRVIEQLKQQAQPRCALLPRSPKLQPLAPLPVVEHRRATCHMSKRSRSPSPPPQEEGRWRQRYRR